MKCSGTRTEVVNSMCNISIGDSRTFPVYTCDLEPQDFKSQSDASFMHIVIPFSVFLYILIYALSICHLQGIFKRGGGGGGANRHMTIASYGLICQHTSCAGVRVLMFAANNK